MSEEVKEIRVIKEDEFNKILADGIAKNQSINLEKRQFIFPINLGIDISVSITFEGSIFEQSVAFIKIIPNSSCINPNIISYNFTKFKESVKFDNCIFKSSCSFENSAFEKTASFVGTIFEKNVSFVRAKFLTTQANFGVTIFNGTADFILTYFNNGASLFRSKIANVITFRNCNFSGINDFSKINNNLGLRKKGKINFSESVFAGTLNFTNSYLESIEFEDNDFQKHIILPDENNLKEVTRNFYRLAKHQKIAQHDQVGALEFYAKEMHKHAEEVKAKYKNFFPYLFKFVLFNCLYFRICWTIRRKIFKKQHSLKFYSAYKKKIENNMRKFKKRLSNFGDYMIMLLSSLTDYGLNWAKGLGIFVLVIITASLIGALFSYLKYSEYGYWVRFFSTLFKLINPASLLNPTNFIQSINFTADPTCTLYKTSMYTEFCINKTNEIRWGNFLNLLWVIMKDTFIFIWSIFYAVMGYQIYRAFRKYSRSLE